jgi:uncharacterized protein YukE
MPAITTILVTAATIASTAKTVSGIIRDIQETRNNIIQIRDNRMQQVWKSSTNADSSTFSQRMQELELDIQKMLDCLQEYHDLLNKSATEYERTQRDVQGKASGLKSPTNF